MCALSNRIHRAIYRHPKPKTRFLWFSGSTYRLSSDVGSKNLKIRVTIILIAEPLFIMEIKNNLNEITVSWNK